MKTISINSSEKSLRTREIIAWIVFICAIALFSATVAFAQDQKSGDKSTIRIKIEKNENGHKTKIDTTVTKDQLPELKEHLKQSGIDFDMDDENSSFANAFSDAGNNNIVIRMDKEKFKEDMKKMRKDLAKMKDQLKDIHIEINGDDDDEGNFNFNMNMPHPPSENWSMKMPKKHAYSYSYSYNGEDVPDSLNDESHIIINGKTDEDKPEFEKEISGKNGEKIFVYKRKLPKESEKSKTSLGINHLKVYPNPAPQGKISLSFRAAPDAEVTVSITDGKGKEVFTDKKKDFNGEYFNQIDLSQKGKGNYTITVSQGDDTVSKKITVE